MSAVGFLDALGDIAWMPVFRDFESAGSVRAALPSPLDLEPGTVLPLTRSPRQCRPSGEGHCDLVSASLGMILQPREAKDVPAALRTRAFSQLLHLHDMELIHMPTSGSIGALFHIWGWSAPLPAASMVAQLQAHAQRIDACPTEEGPSASEMMVTLARQQASRL